MRLLVAIEGRFSAHGEDVFHHHLTYERFWKRYLEVFDSVLVAARVERVENVESGLGKATGPNVDFCALPDYHGPWQYARRRAEVRAALRKGIARAEAYLLRVPGTVGTVAWRILPKGTPFGVEVVGDPWLTLAPASVRSAGSPVFRRLARRELKWQCREAAAVLYVTRRALQERYPPKENAYSLGCSDVSLDAEWIRTDLRERLALIAAIPRRLTGDGPPVRLGFIGSFSQAHKLPHVHLEALARCVARGMTLTLDMIGDGTMLEAMRALARRLGVAERVCFRGRLPGGKPIFDALDTFDLFLNATAAEGLPRVVIEAMSRGCPCIASDVGGTSELLEPDHLVPPGNPEALAETVVRVLADPAGMAEAVRRSTQVAHEYTSEELDHRRRMFYQQLRERTESWRARIGG